MLPAFLCLILVNQATHNGDPRRSEAPTRVMVTEGTGTNVTQNSTAVPALYDSIPVAPH